FLFGGLVVLLFSRISDRWRNPAVMQYVKLLPSAMAATITLGVAPLLFVQLVYPRQVYSAAIVSGWFWLLIIDAAILGYYCMYVVSFKKSLGGRVAPLLWVVMGTFLYISLIYNSVFALAENPDLCRSLYAGEQNGWAFNPDIAGWIFRRLHIVTGAITVGGFSVGWVGRRDDSVYRAGKQFFTWGMAAAAVFGFVYLFTLDKYLLLFMRTPGIWAITVGIVLSAGALHFYFRKKFTPAAVMLPVSILMMVYSRHHVRLLHLADAYDPSSMPVQPQWSIFAVFLVCFLIAIGLVWYMLKLFFTGQRNEV
ncbi:MAG: hypothetical protein V1791_05225, partial [Pseudomonadota bacterium]